MKQIFTLIFLALTTIAGFSQDTMRMEQQPLRHEMTPEELLRKGEIGRGFVETAPPAGPIRNIPEYDRMQGALVRYPFGIPIALIKEMAMDITVTTVVASNSQKNTVISQYVANGVDTSHCNFLIAQSDSYWTRDYGPWFESDSANQIGIVDFPYNRPRPNDDEIPKLMAAMLGIPWFGMNVISTGGNYMTDGFGESASTDLVWNENPSQTPAQIAEKMNNYLGITNFQVVPDPNLSSTIDHIDCWAKFLTPDRILIRKVLTSDPEYNALESAAAYWASQTCSFGYNYKVFRVQTPQDQPYSNSVILNNKVLVPFMNSPWDDSAKAVYEAAMPGYEVIGFIGNPSTPWVSTDALHCRVMGIADIGLLHINHFPLTGNQPCETAYPIDADIIASSHQPVIADSVLIHYRVNGGSFNLVSMQQTSANHYHGVIPKQPAGSLVEYFLSAADESGRRETMPLIGAADPYKFNTVYTNLAAVPDTLWFLTREDCVSGKITQLHNYLSSALSLNQVQQNGSLPWYVDSMSVSTLPYLINPGNSVAIRVKMTLPISCAPGMLFEVDSLKYTTAAGDQYVIIMVNSDLLTGINYQKSLPVLGNNYPNPFRNATTIPVIITRRSHVTLEILDMRGVKVTTLLDGVFEPGQCAVTWNGDDRNGNKLPSGIYFYRLTGENQTSTKRLVLIE
ncbi:MAG: agmatine deiminase family protein [Bacteroidota bacterium]